jgi:hypothetical protein
MGTGIQATNGRIVTGCNDIAIQHDNSANRNLTFSSRKPRLIECQPHGAYVIANRTVVTCQNAYSNSPALFPGLSGTQE